MTINNINNEKYSNKRYTLSFTLSTNMEGNQRVLKELRNFINNKDWCSELIRVNSHEY